MYKISYLVVVILLFSCTQKNKETDPNTNNSDTVAEDSAVQKYVLTDKTERFLWREDRYNAELKDTFNTIIINEELSTRLTDPERAALGYVSTFIGNDCDWDGAYKNDRSNLKCKVLSALNLGYQCSETHLGFLRKWFKDDVKVSEELQSENCPTTPGGATVQETFDEITLMVKGNLLSVYFQAQGVNLREGYSWSWNETNIFQLHHDHIQLIKKNKSEVKTEHFDEDENEDEL